MLSEIQNYFSSVKSKIFSGAIVSEIEQDRELYFAVVSASRAVKLYRDWKIPDNFDGRFDSLLAHFFITARVLREKDQKERADRLADWLMRDSDRSLRESGVTDHGISRKMRAVAQAYAGRMTAYTEAFAVLKEQGETAFCQALFKNIYRARPEGERFAPHVSAYSVRAYRTLFDLSEVTPENVIHAFHKALNEQAAPR